MRYDICVKATLSSIWLTHIFTNKNFAAVVVNTYRELLTNTTIKIIVKSVQIVTG